jgi:APA family basic amino acid/polyamine antiporter
VQNVFTSAKVLALAAVVLVGVLAKNAAARSPQTSARAGTNFWAGSGWHALHAVQVGVGGPTALVGLLTVVAVVQVGSLFSSDAWNNVTFTAGEIENPKRNLPLSLAIGAGVVQLLYLPATSSTSACCRWRVLEARTTIAGRGISSPRRTASRPP